MRLSHVGFELLGRGGVYFCAIYFRAIKKGKIRENPQLCSVILTKISKIIYYV